ncbi:MAG TPA: hypothetical protein PKJ99_01225 [Thermoanaerobaculales bacterium]|nr:hypothetical protein [Thermoanaerobaculales bacterium]HPA81384.1 hypothetical protein [Thermoanaerobaculales bacterium]HQL29001.1 hypothetical protein [Thermoanaerobaculales bacterium]HQN96233.1 hypothetical protein [Thermoanaerobaculales bacterium]HQP42284.1 hypothetical protein [Thermoanaerobaculales bacterium]
MLASRKPLVSTLVMLAVWLAGCAHYRAASLAVLSSSAVNALDEAGFTLVAARLTDEDGVARVLGPRSRRLASAAVVVQLSLTAKDAPVELGAGALRLALSSGEVIDPLAPGRLAALISIPEESPSSSGSWQTPSGEVSSQPVDPIVVAAALSAVGLAAVVRREGAVRYCDEARPDIERKTALPRIAAAGDRFDLLAVFVPTRQIAESEPLRLLAELSVGPRRIERSLTLSGAPRP